VDAVGPGVTEVAVGDRVAFAMVVATYAEYVIGDVAKLAPLPAGVSSTQAAGALLQGLTAHFLAHSTYALSEGESCLIHAGAGGVGHLLIQVAKQRGARVLATVSSPEKEAFARQAGADEVIRYTETDFLAETKLLTNGRGVDVVYDSVGKDTFMASIQCLRPRGYMVLYGQSSGAAPPLDPQLLNRYGSIFLTRPFLGHYIASREELLGRTGDLFAWLAAGRLLLHVERVYPLAEAAEAHRALESRQTRGKLVLAVPG
jgi:NADPH2:quinone reductase